MLIVYKTLEARIQSAQARRIRCAFCSTRHTVLALATHTHREDGLPLLSSDAVMRREAYTSALADAREAALARHRGEGRCPECHQLQPFMKRAYVMDALWNTIPAPVIAVPLGFFASTSAHISSSTIILAVVACVAVVLAWNWLTRVILPIRRITPARSLTDHDLGAVLDRLQGRIDLPTFWARHLKLEDQGAMLLGLGLVDEVGDLPVPPDLDLAACLTRAEVNLSAALS